MDQSDIQAGQELLDALQQDVDTVDFSGGILDSPGVSTALAWFIDRLHDDPSDPDTIGFACTGMFRLGAYTAKSVLSASSLDQEAP